MSDDSCEIPTAPTDNEAVDDNPNFEPGAGKHLLLFADPMCSWCWGFQPELKGLIDTVNDNPAADGSPRAQFHVVMGGLRPGTTETWQGEMQSYIRHHWEDVAMKTGQPFDYSRMDDADFVYDTEPSCRAVTVVRELNPELAMNAYHDLQRAFYAEGKDITKCEVIADVVAATGVNRARFMQLFTSPAARDLVMFDFKRTRAFGVQGFPTIVCADDGQYAFLTLGYQKLETMKPLLEEWLNDATETAH